MDSLKFHSVPPCPTLLRPLGGPPLKRLYGCFRGDPPAGRVACSHLLPFRTPHAVRLCLLEIFAPQIFARQPLMTDDEGIMSAAADDGTIITAFEALPG
jgi:hypothetical protein